MDPVTVGCVKYLNTVPLIEGLDKLPQITLVPAAPSKLVGMLTGKAETRIDIGLVSLVDIARAREPLALIPAGMIGCDGPTLTVRVFSGVPIDRITELHADTDSHTSVVLARLLLARRFNTTPKLIDFDARERVARGPTSGSPSEAHAQGWPEAVLMIGDKVVTDSPPAVRYPYQIDLGEVWHEWTGLPFVYAMWMCRAAEAQDLRIRSAAALLDRQLRHNLTRLDWVISTKAPLHRWPEDLARLYIGKLLRYVVGDRERQAVARFLHEAAELNLIPSVSPGWVELSPPGTRMDI